jgi:hypothetical protein
MTPAVHLNRLFRCSKPLLLLFVPCINGPRGCALCPLSPSVVTSALHQAPRSLDPLPAGLSVPTHPLVLAIEWSSFTCNSQLCWLFVSRSRCLTLCPFAHFVCKCVERNEGMGTSHNCSNACLQSSSASSSSSSSSSPPPAPLPPALYHHHLPYPPLPKKTLPGAPLVLATYFWVPSMRRPALPPPTSQPPSSALRH